MSFFPLSGMLSLYPVELLHLHLIASMPPQACVSRISLLLQTRGCTEHHKPVELRDESDMESVGYLVK